MNLSWGGDRRGEKRSPWRGQPSTRVFTSKEIIKQITGGVLWKDALMCLLNQRLLLTEAGGLNRLQEDWTNSVPVCQNHSPSIAVPALHFSPPKYQTKSKSDEDALVHGSFSLISCLIGREEKKLSRVETHRVLAVPNVPRTWERLSLLLPECIHFTQCKY